MTDEQINNMIADVMAKALIRTALGSGGITTYQHASPELTAALLRLSAGSERPIIDTTPIWGFAEDGRRWQVNVSPYPYERERLHP